MSSQASKDEVADGLEGVCVMELCGMKQTPLKDKGGYRERRKGNGKHDKLRSRAEYPKGTLSLAAYVKTASVSVAWQVFCFSLSQ